MKKLLLIIPLLLAVTAFDCRDKPPPPGTAATPYPACSASDDDMDAIYRALDGVGIPKSEAGFKIVTRTPGGSCVRSVVAVPPEALAAIDTGIRTQIERAGSYNPTWTRKTNLNQYRVLFVEPSTFHAPHPRDGEKCTTLVNTPGSPCLLVKGVQSAGTVIGAGTMSPLGQIYIVLPHQQGQQWRFLDYLAASARNESEHDRECSEEGLQGENCIKFQTQSDVHPHWP